MEHQKLRIGFIGAGGNTRKMHIPGFHKLENVELAVVANQTLASAEKVAKQEGIKRAVDSWQEVIADPSVDAICIGTSRSTCRLMQEKVTTPEMPCSAPGPAPSSAKETGNYIITLKTRAMSCMIWQKISVKETTWPKNILRNWTN